MNKHPNATPPSIDVRSSFPKVKLIEPSPSGYLLIAAEVDARPPFMWPSNSKRALLEDCKRLCKQLEQTHGSVSATVFTALLIPPHGGAPVDPHTRTAIARYDVALLIRCATVEKAERLRTSPCFEELETRVGKSASRTLVITASNAKRIAPVDHHRQGIFLFNYFIANDTETNLAVWEYTAGWFQQKTGLDNSEVLLPLEKSVSTYSIINHCRWDRLRDILLPLLLSRSLRSHVVANFARNHVTAVPVLYRLA